MVLSIDDELPWDPLWAYVLGEGDDQYVRKPTTQRKTRRTSKGSQEEGFLSYINDIIPEPESRDSDKQEIKRSSSQNKRGSFGSKDETTNSAGKTKTAFWNRGKRGSGSEATESRESWEWRIDLNGSEDEVEAHVPSKRTSSFSKALDKPKSTEKQAKSQASSNPYACEPWEWQLDMGSDHASESKDSKASSKKNRAAPKSMSRRERRKKNAEVKNAQRSQKDVSSHESWDWQLGSITGSTTDDTKKARRGLWRGREKQPAESWDWSASNQEAKRDARRVSFARGQKKNDESEWTHPDDVAAQLERSQNTLLDWVGLNESSSDSETMDEDEFSSDRMPAARSERGQAAFASTKGTRLGKRDIDVSPEAAAAGGGFVFGSIFSNWGDLSSEDDSTLNSSTTQESSAASTEEFSEDGTKTTQRTDLSSLVIHEPVRAEVTEVRLAYQPDVPDKGSANLLPIITEEGSLEETHVYSDERSGSSSDVTQKLRGAGNNRNKLNGVVSAEDSALDIPRHRRIGSFNSILEGVESAASKPEAEDSDMLSDISREVDVLPQKLPRSSGRVVPVCRSVKKLSDEELKWTKQTGVPFHELSQQELSQIFPKVRSITDGSQSSSSTVRVHPGAIGNSKSGSAHFQASLDSNGPQSLYEYEYETGVHMYASYNAVGVGVDGLTVHTAQPPIHLKSLGKHTEVLLQVEASTVSRTDCSIRQGNWQRQPEPPIPNTPGVDVVGRIYRIDTETKKRYGLSVGDRVISLVKWGGNSRYLVMDPSTAVKVPDAVDPAVAVCLTETYLTAFQVLHCKQNGKARYQDSSLKDKTVLILGNAVTNMGRAIAQLAAHAGATQVFAMAKKKHFEQLSELGIGPLNQDSSDGWKDLFGMIDLIISIDVEVVEVHRKLLAGKGHIVAVMNGVKQGADRGRKARLACNRKGRMIQRRLTSYDIYEEWETNIDRCKLDLGHLIKLLDENVVEPNILDRVALHKVARAQSIVESKRLSGFIVCEPWLVAKSRAIRL